MLRHGDRINATRRCIALHTVRPQADIARTFNVDPATICRLAAASPFEHGAVAVR
jgi:hypothetical protein